MEHEHEVVPYISLCIHMAERRRSRRDANTVASQDAGHFRYNAGTVRYLETHVVGRHGIIHIHDLAGGSIGVEARQRLAKIKMNRQLFIFGSKGLYSLC